MFFLTFFMYAINKFLFEMNRLSREGKEEEELIKEAGINALRESRVAKMQASLSGGLDMSSPEATLLGMSKSKLDLL